jgi:hypothetical protein
VPRFITVCSEIIDVHFLIEYLVLVCVIGIIIIVLYLNSSLFVICIPVTHIVVQVQAVFGILTCSSQYHQRSFAKGQIVYHTYHHTFKGQKYSDIMSTDRADKSKSTIRSMAKMIKMPSSTSNSGSTDASKKIDDVPLNEKVSKKTSSSTSKPKSSAVAPSQSTTVSGNKDLKLKVSHNDAGRVIISLSNTDRVLVQVQVDESVLRRGALKKAKKVPEKERPKKKVIVTKPSKTIVKDAIPKKRPSSSTKTAAGKPRDLPEEETSTRKKRSAKLKRVIVDTIDENVELDHNSKHKGKRHVPSSMDSVGSFSMTYSDDDSTRSPKDLHRPSATITPKPPGKPSTVMEVNTPSTEPSLGGGDVFETASVMTPSWDRRKQKLMQFKRQSSGLSSPGMIGPEDDSVDRSKIPLQQQFGDEAKLEETASNDGGMSTDSGVFSSPFQQRRLQNRQKRLGKQRAETETAFRSTRSIRSSGGTSGVNAPSLNLSVGQFMVVENKRSHHLERQSSANRATHTRTIEPDDVDSENATSNRIRSTLAEVKNVELTNKGDPRSGRSSFKGRYPPNREDANEEELLGHNKVGGKFSGGWVKKVCDKVCNKRLKKDHQKLV